jgi:arylsulfate sulfotransferase
VDIVGDLIVVLDRNWNAVWYWDAFDPLGGGSGYAQMPVSRTAVLNEQCGLGNSGCLSLFLLGPGVAPKVHDWLHGNCLYYWPHDGAPAPSKAPGDLLWSSRHQDWVLKIDYQDGAGTGDILWRMGPSGDFFFVNTYNDPWPWFSHQHEPGIENNGTGVFDVMDNGNTRVSPPGESTGGVPGLGSVNCKPDDCNSRGMALTIDETGMQVEPVMSVNLGVYSSAMGSAQLLADGNYFFLAAIVGNGTGTLNGYDIQIQPMPGTDTGPQVMNIKGPPSYRSWQMPNLYNPPTI